MIYGRKQLQVEKQIEKTEWDYIGCLYPEGNISEEYMYLFNHEQIDKVFFMGYQDEEEYEFLKNFSQKAHKSHNKISKKVQNFYRSDDSWVSTIIGRWLPGENLTSMGIEIKRISSNARKLSDVVPSAYDGQDAKIFAAAIGKLQSEFNIVESYKFITKWSFLCIHACVTIKRTIIWN